MHINNNDNSKQDIIKALQHIRSVFYCNDEKYGDNHYEVIKNNSTIILKVATNIEMIITSLYNEKITSITIETKTKKDTTKIK